MKTFLIICALLLSVSMYAHDSIEVVMQHEVINGKEFIKLSIINNNNSKIIILNRGNYDKYGGLDQSPLSYYTIIGYRSYSSPGSFDKYGETSYNLFYNKDLVQKLETFAVNGRDTFEYGPAWLFSGSEYSYSVFPDSAKQNICKLQIKVFLTYYYKDEATSMDGIYKKEFLSNVVTR